MNHAIVIDGNWQFVENEKWKRYLTAQQHQNRNIAKETSVNSAKRIILICFFLCVLLHYLSIGKRLITQLKFWMHTQQWIGLHNRRGHCWWNVDQLNDALIADRPINGRKNKQKRIFLFGVHYLFRREMTNNCFRWWWFLYDKWAESSIWAAKSNRTSCKSNRMRNDDNAGDSSYSHYLL